MTLLIAVIAAVISTVVWYCTSDSGMRLGFLSLMYWGASLMWLVDAVREYLEIGYKYFYPSAEDMINDAYLGASVVVLGLVIWLVSVLISDPKGKIKKALSKK